MLGDLGLINNCTKGLLSIAFLTLKRLNCTVASCEDWSWYQGLETVAEIELDR